MTNVKKSKIVGEKLSSGGKKTLKGLGSFASGTLTVLGAMGVAQQRANIREKLEGIDNYDLDIAKEIIEERIAKR